MQFYQLSQTSLAKSGSGIVEEYIPLWMADGTYCSFNSGGTSAGNGFLADGVNDAPSGSSSSSTRLFTLNSSWSPSTSFAFEATLGGNGATCNLALWDFSLTTPSMVSSSQIAIAAPNVIVTRTAKFTLIPGHSYGITGWVTGGGGYELVDASLVVFGQ